MNWGILSSIFILATVKFMFAPFTGYASGLSFWETFFTSIAGGSFSATIFFFFSELIMSISHKRKIKNEERAISESKILKKKKKFTKTNRAIIRVKRTLGIYGICFWAPFFLSVPIGSIIVAKFYGKQREAFPLIIVGMFLNAFLMTSLSYLLLH